MAGFIARVWRRPGRSSKVSSVGCCSFSQRGAFGLAVWTRGVVALPPGGPALG